MKEKIKYLIKRTFGLSDISDEISTSSCEKWDSLNHLNLIVEIEAEFNVSIEPEDIAEMRSLSDIEKVLNKLLNH